VAEPVVTFIGLISIATDGGLFLNVGNFNRNAPGMLVGFFSQFWPSLRIELVSH
jgi:hypothetical protein